MIKAVIFDCFGVLTTEGFGVFRAKYFRDDPDKKEKANRLMDELNTGRLDNEVFVSELADLSGVERAKVNEYLTHNKANEPLFEFIRLKLKPKYKIGMLSNAGANWLDEMFNPKDLALFDDVVLSYEVGLIKPEPEFYLLAAARLKVSPQECLFIDDSTGHCEGAQKVGMRIVHYKNFEQAKDSISRVLSARADN
jgi:epoxide hydrolase-like predicted phosphatase